LNFHLVDARFVADHLVGVVFVLLDKRENAPLNGMRDERSHLLERLGQRMEFFFEWAQ
jgi:hypothetical protein